MHALFTLSLILIAVVESSTASEFCSTVYADYQRRQLAYFSEDGVFDIESGAKHVVSCVMPMRTYSSDSYLMSQICVSNIIHIISIISPLYQS